jgi:penicillin-binding protein 1C
VLLFATRLSEGSHEFSYIVRATTTGTFRTAPTHAEEMYEPEVFGRTATHDRGPVMIRRFRGLFGKRVRFYIALAVAGTLAAAAWIRLGPIPADLLAAGVDSLDRGCGPARLAALRSSIERREPARPVSMPRAFLRRWSTPRLPPRITASSGIQASIRLPSPARSSATFALALSLRAAPRSRSRRQRFCWTGGWPVRVARIAPAPGPDREVPGSGAGDAPGASSDKPEILALYLKRAPYGNQVVGAGRASEVYFGVPPSLLTVAQATFLAALPQRPSAYNPYKDPKPALRRQRRIIDTLVHQKLISPDEAHTARNERLQIEPAARAFAAPHFVEMVLAAQGGTRPSRLTTTIDASLQETVADIVRAHRESLVKHGAHNVAVVVLDNTTSEWLAWEGSGDYFDRDNGGAINGGITLRQPGSALKPFVYAQGFEAGETPASVLPDVPSSYPTAEPGIVYSPRNYDGAFHGPLRARQALAGSQNVPAVALASRVGVPDLLRLLRSAGFSAFDKTASHYGLGVALGNAEVTLADLVSGYAVFARGGVWQEPRAVVTDSNPPARRVMSPRAAFWVTDILSDDEARAYVFGRGGSLEFPFPVAVKTGTSQAYRDNWTVGYTREVTVGIWVGNFDRRPLIGSSGVTGAAPIFHAVMLAAQRAVHGREEPRPNSLPDPPTCGSTPSAPSPECVPARRARFA